MITDEIRAIIWCLILREGWKIETAARRFGVHHSVVRRVIHEGEANSKAQGPVASNLDPRGSMAYPARCARIQPGRSRVIR